MNGPIDARVEFDEDDYVEPPPLITPELLRSALGLLIVIAIGILLLLFTYAGLYWKDQWNCAGASRTAYDYGSCLGTIYREN